ncbi:phage baseplate protein [Actinacidiphila soli]|uniref:phage baseplate protein n=1 Tax=Actinacidiphila soli TaxID=2487275 RepID=UPI000FCB0650|nr:hypothetical protein [Actinacidiphila soli]
MNAYGGAMPARRAVIGLGAAAALSAALTARGAQARAADRPAPQPADDLRAQGRPWIRRGLLNHSTVLQSFSFDERHGRMYALQVMEDGIRLPGEKRAYSHAERAMRGDLCLDQLSMSGVLIGYMYLKGFGHGAAFGVEETARAAGTVWTEWDSHPVRPRTRHRPFPLRPRQGADPHQPHAVHLPTRTRFHEQHRCPRSGARTAAAAVQDAGGAAPRTV